METNDYTNDLLWLLWGELRREEDPTGKEKLLRASVVRTQREALRRDRRGFGQGTRSRILASSHGAYSARVCGMPDARVGRGESQGPTLC